MRQSSVLGQLLKLTPRREFEILAEQHHVGQPFRKTTRWNQFVVLLTAQLAGHSSLREIDHSGKALQPHLLRLGCKPLNRSTLGRLNSRQSPDLYRDLFQRLLSRCQEFAGQRKLPVNRKLISLDSTLIHLCLKLFPWADCSAYKAGVKVHVGLDHASWLPEIVCITEGRRHDHQVLPQVKLIPGTVYIFDRGYCDYAWFDRLTKANCPFVTRAKFNMRYEAVKDSPLVPGSGVLADQNIHLTGVQGKKHTRQLRRIHYFDPGTQKDLVFITNNLKWSAATIAAIYKERWQIELFFKWIKQRAKIKRFVGNSMNAVMTQIWIALIAYLITAFVKLSRHLDHSLTQIFRLIRATLFDHRDLWGVVIHATIPPQASSDLQLELKLA